MNIGSLTGEITLDDALSAVLLKIDSNMKRFENTTQTSMNGVKSSMLGAAAVGSFLGNTMSTMAMEVVSWAKNIATSSIMAGARLEQLGLATRYLGEKAGYSGKFIDDLSKKIEKQGIDGISARESINSLLSAHVDLANAEKLSTIARDMQSISGRKSSEVLQAITRALATGNTEILRSVGFQNISIESLTRADNATKGHHGSVVGAARAQLVLNAVLKEGADYAGLYDENMKTAGKQMSSFLRATDQISQAIGTVLLPVTSAIIKEMYSLASEFRDFIELHGPGLKRTMEDIAATVKSVINKTVEYGKATFTAIKDVIEWWKKLPDPIKDVIKITGELTAAVWILNWALRTTLITSIGATAAPMLAFATRWGTQVALVRGLQLGWIAVGAALPLALFAAMVKGMFEVDKAFDRLDRFRELGYGGFWDFIKIKDDDNWVRNILRVVGVLDKLPKLGDYKDSMPAPETRDEVWEQFTKKKKLPGGDKPPPEKSSYTSAVESETEKYLKASEAYAVTNKVLGGLLDTQWKNHDVQKLALADMQGLIDAHQALTPELRARYDSLIKTAAAEEALQVWTLQSHMVTSRQIEDFQQQGLNLDQIAFKYGVTRSALEKYMAKTDEAANRKEEADQAMLGKNAGEVADDVAEQEKANAMALALDKMTQDGLKESALSATDFKIAQIHKETEELIASYPPKGTQIKQFTDFALAEEKRRVNEILGINERLKAVSKKTLQDKAALEKSVLDEMMLHQDDYTQAEIDAQKQILKAANAAAKGTSQTWKGAATEILDALAGMFDGINSKVGQAMHVLASGLNSMLKATSTAAKAAIGFAMGASIVDSVAGGNKGASKTTQGAIGAFSGAAAGIGIGGGIGMMVAGPYGAAVGSAVGAVIGFVVGGVAGIVKAIKKGRQDIKDALNKWNDIFAGLVTSYGSMQNAAYWAEKFGVNLNQSTSPQGVRQLEFEVGKLNAAVQALDQDTQKYGLTWADLTNEADKFFQANRAAGPLLESYARLKAAGYDESKILKAMASDTNDWLTAALKAGVKIPQSMAPIIRDLIKTGQLTERNARLMLGLADDTMPSLADITEAANRYGLKLDELGPKVQQLRINEAADQIVKDFNLLTLAGVPFEKLMEDIHTRTTDSGQDFDKMSKQAQDSYLKAGGVVTDVVSGMRTDVQDLVNKAIADGATLPASMKPMIEKMIKAGLLTDDTGEKLTDLSKLTFAADLSKMFEDLMTKLDELIVKITTGVGGALDGLGNHRPTIAVNTTSTGGGSADNNPATVHMAGGGVNSSGSDTIHAMIGPNERVLSPSENHEYERGDNSQVIIELDSNVLARAVVPKIPGVTRRYKVSR